MATWRVATKVKGCLRRLFGDYDHDHMYRGREGETGKVRVGSRRSSGLVILWARKLCAPHGIPGGGGGEHAVRCRWVRSCMLGANFHPAVPRYVCLFSQGCSSCVRGDCAGPGDACVTTALVGTNMEAAEGSEQSTEGRSRAQRLGGLHGLAKLANLGAAFTTGS